MAETHKRLRWGEDASTNEKAEDLAWEVSGEKQDLIN